MFRLVTLWPVRAPKTAWQFWSKLQWSCFCLSNRIPWTEDPKNEKKKERNLTKKKESKQTARTTSTTRWSLKLDGYCQTKTTKQKNKIVAERRWPSKYHWNTIGSLSNHDDDGNKNPTNLHIWKWKIVFLHALHVHISFFAFLKTFSFFLRREMTSFAVVWTTWAYDNKMFNLSSYVPSAGSNLIPG